MTDEIRPPNPLRVAALGLMKRAALEASPAMKETLMIEAFDKLKAVGGPAINPLPLINTLKDAARRLGQSPQEIDKIEKDMEAAFVADPHFPMSEASAAPQVSRPTGFSAEDTLRTFRLGCNRSGAGLA